MPVPRMAASSAACLAAALALFGPAGAAYAALPTADLATDSLASIRSDSLSMPPPAREPRSLALDLVDTLAVHLETGASTDLTNELYYEDAFVDTTFLGRRLVSTPESNTGALLHAPVVGTRSDRAT